MSRPSPRWAFMERFDIPDANDPNVTYLRRLRIVHPRDRCGHRCHEGGAPWA